MLPGMTEPIAMFQVRRDDLAATRLIHEALEPGAGEAVCRVDQFALTANTVTYAAHGVSLRYWDFFPAPDGWGNVPAWGTATVTVSHVEGLAPGDRLYGYFTMAHAVKLRLQPTGPTGLAEVSPHRADLPAAYNRYRRWDDSMGDEHLTALLQPLHATSFLLDDLLSANQWFGAREALLSSASSKTALALAHAMRQHADRPHLIGLTSPRNLAFTQATGAYDEVILYAEVTSRNASTPILYADMAGDRALRAAIHTHRANALVHSAAVGDTHQGLNTRTDPLPGPRPAFFFAPTWLAQRQADWGHGQVAARLDRAWAEFAAWAPSWLRVVHEHGPQAMAARWAEALGGGTPPDRGIVLSL